MSTQLQSPTQLPHSQEQAPAFTIAPEGVRLTDLSHSYVDRNRDVVQALASVTLEIHAHETLAVVGPSGCGKTTLLELICGLQRPQTGRIATAPAVLMPQRDLLLPWMSALDNAALALRAVGIGRAQARSSAQPLFDELGLAGFERSMPNELSGGMRQRVAFLRTLLSGKPVLCLDEPFGALDAITRLQMQEWLAGALEQRPRTVVLVTHDVEEAILLADRIIVLSPRPGRVSHEIEIALPRPRMRAEQAVHALRGRVLEALGLARSSETRLGGSTQTAGAA